MESSVHVVLGWMGFQWASMAESSGWWKVFHGIDGEEREVEGNGILMPHEEGEGRVCVMWRVRSMLF